MTHILLQKSGKDTKKVFGAELVSPFAKAKHSGGGDGGRNMRVIKAVVTEVDELERGGKKKSDNSEYPWIYGSAKLKTVDGRKSETVTVLGAVPRSTLPFKFKYNLNKTQTLVPYILPELSKRHISLTAQNISETLNVFARNAPIMPIDIKDASLFPSFNPVVLLFRAEALQCVADFDVLNKTQYVKHLKYIFSAVDYVKNNATDAGGFLNTIKTKTLVVANFWKLFKDVFDLTFFELAMLPLGDILRIAYKLLVLGPRSVFRPEYYHFNKKGEFVGSDSGFNHNSSFGDDSFKNVEVIDVNDKTSEGHDDDEGGGGGGGEGGDSRGGISSMITPSRVRIVLTFRRALTLFNRQKLKAMKFLSDCGDDDDDTDSENSDIGDDGDVNDYNKAATSDTKKILAMFLDDDDGDDRGGGAKPQKATAAAASTVNNNQTKNKKSTTAVRLVHKLTKVKDYMDIKKPLEVVLMCTDNRRCKVPSLNMADLTTEEWMTLKLEDFFREMFNAHRHFCVPPSYLCDMIRKVQVDYNFPVSDVDKNVVGHTIRKLVAESSMVVFDTVEKSVMLVEDFNRRFPTNDDLLVDNIDAGFHLALFSIINIEFSLAASLVGFIHKREAEHMKRLKFDCNFAELGTDTPDKIYSEEQQRAIIMGQVSPFLIVNGGAGRGKSRVRDALYTQLRKLHPGAVILCTAFKNDTVNQMRDSIMAIDGKKFDKNKTIFRTIDSFHHSWTRAARERNNNNNNTRSSELSPDENCPPINFCFVEEAMMASTGHYLRLMQGLDVLGEHFKKLLLFGDQEQLEPINAGAPFLDFVNAYADSAVVTLTHNYRTRQATLNNFLDRLRHQDYEDDDDLHLFDETDVSDAELLNGCNYLFTDMPYDARGRPPELLKAYARRTLEFLMRIDPAKRRYNELMLTCPYRDMSEFVSIMVDMHYFYGYDVHTDTGPDNCWTMDRALQVVMEPVKYRDRPHLMMGTTRVCTRTDRDNKMIAMGRVGVVTKILYHIQDQDISDTTKPGIISVKSTAEPMPRTLNNSQITVELDNDTLVSFRYANEIYRTLKPSICRTVHRGQGAQAEIVFCLMPPGRLGNYRMWYTAASRAQGMAVTISDGDTIASIMETSPPVRYSTLQDILHTDTRLREQTLPALWKEGIRFFEALMAERALLADLEQENDANANDDDNNNHDDSSSGGRDTHDEDEDFDCDDDNDDDDDDANDDSSGGRDTHDEDDVDCHEDDENDALTSFLNCSSKRIKMSIDVDSNDYDDDDEKDN